MNVGCQIGLVDHEYIRLRYAGTVLAGYLVAGGDVYDVYEVIDQSRAECESKVVAARFYEHYVRVGEPRLHLLDGRYVHRRILPHGGMRACTGLDAYYALFDEYAFEHFADMLGIFGRYHVIGYYQQFVSRIEQARGYGFDKRRLARSHRAAYSDSACVFHLVSRFLIHEHSFGSLLVQRGYDVDLRHERRHVVEGHLPCPVVDRFDLVAQTEHYALRIVVRDAQAAQRRAQHHVYRSVTERCEQPLFRYFAC